MCSFGAKVEIYFASLLRRNQKTVASKTKRAYSIFLQSLCWNQFWHEILLDPDSIITEATFVKSLINSEAALKRIQKVRFASLTDDSELDREFFVWFGWEAKQLRYVSEKIDLVSNQGLLRSTTTHPRGGLLCVAETTFQRKSLTKLALTNNAMHASIQIILLNVGAVKTEILHFRGRLKFAFCLVSTTMHLWKIGLRIRELSQNFAWLLYCQVICRYRLCSTFAELFLYSHEIDFFDGVMHNVQRKWKFQLKVLSCNTCTLMILLFSTTISVGITSSTFIMDNLR